MPAPISPLSASRLAMSRASCLSASRRSTLILVPRPKAARAGKARSSAGSPPRMLMLFWCRRRALNNPRLPTFKRGLLPEIGRLWLHLVLNPLKTRAVDPLVSPSLFAGKSDWDGFRVWTASVNPLPIATEPLLRKSKRQGPPPCWLLAPTIGTEKAGLLITSTFMSGWCNRSSDLIARLC